MVQELVKYNPPTSTYVPEIVTLVSSLKQVLRGFNARLYVGQSSASKLKYSPNVLIANVPNN